MTTTARNDYDSDVQEQSFEQGFRRIIYYNRDYDYRSGTPIAEGGFGIEVTSGQHYAPIGPVMKIKHMGVNGIKEDEEAVSPKIEVAIVGVSEAYTQYWPDFDRSKRPILLPRFFKSPDPVNKDQQKNAASGISLFVVCKCDKERELYELPMKTYNVDHVFTVLNQATVAANGIADYFKDQGNPVNGKLPRFILWMTLKAGETTLEGGGPKKGACTHIVVEWPKPTMTSADYHSLIVSKEDYAHFRAQRKELDTMLASGFRKPQPAANLPELKEAYYQQKAIAAPANDEQPKQIQSKGNPETLPHADWPVFKWVGVNGRESFEELVKLVTHEANYTLEDALAVNNIATLADVPLDLSVAKFMQNLLHIG